MSESRENIIYCIAGFIAGSILATCAAILLMQVADGASVTLAWDPNPEPDLASYVIYYGPASREYTHATNVGNVTLAKVLGVSDSNTTYFAVTAVASNGLESDFSDEVTNNFNMLDLRVMIESCKQLGGVWQTNY